MQLEEGSKLQWEQNVPLIWQSYQLGTVSNGGCKAQQQGSIGGNVDDSAL